MGSMKDAAAHGGQNQTMEARTAAAQRTQTQSIYLLWFLHSESQLLMAWVYASSWTLEAIWYELGVMTSGEPTGAPPKTEPRGMRLS